MKELGSGKCPIGHHAGDEKDGSGLIDMLPFPVILLDRTGQVKAINDNVRSVLGFQGEEMLGKDYFDAFHVEEEVRGALEKLSDELNRTASSIKHEDFWHWLINSGTVYEEEWNYIDKEGRYVTARGRFAPMKESEQIIVSFFDVSNYTSIISSLEDSELKTRMIFETAVDGFVTINEKGIIQSFNRAAEKLFGYTAEEVIGQNVKMLTPPNISVEHDGYLKNYQKTRDAKIIGKGREVYGKRKDDSLFPMYLSVGEGKLSKGKVMYTGIIRDLTEYKKVEDEIRRTNDALEKQNKIKTEVTSVVEVTRGLMDLNELADSAISRLADLTNSAYGTFYIADENEEGEFRLMGTFAYTRRKNMSSRIRVGEGLLGQAALERKIIILTQVPSDHITVDTSLGQSAPNNLIIVPIRFEKTLLGIFELASFDSYTEEKKELMDQVAVAIAPNIQSVLGHERTKRLLDESNRLSDELQAQQDTLQNTNEELQAQQEALRKSNEELQVQQEELRQNNERLTAKEEELRKSNESLREREEELRLTMESQKKLTETLTQQKGEVEKAKKEIERKAGQLEQTSSFKSQFLANMSHELRTPLNSLMILAKLFTENREGNLTEKQIEHAKLIHNAGGELLNLINDILDLAKVESGQMTIGEDTVSFNEIENYVESTFRGFADQKGLEFILECDSNLPSSFGTDEMKLKQVLKNFLSNAFKFTDKGHVKFSMSLIQGNKAAFSVEDTGIGIPKEKLKEVFEAFRQVDGSIQRKYGGTGLGMSISNEYAKLLGGEIQLESKEGKGSTFTLILPVKQQSKNAEQTGSRVSEKPDTPVFSKQDFEAATTVDTAIPLTSTDDRDSITDGDRVVLVIEDDIRFAKILSDIARGNGYKVVHTVKGSEAVKLGEQYKPKAIILDLFLPDGHGYEVLDKLKLNKATRPIPVNVISFDPNRPESMAKGAVNVLQKPVTEEELEMLLQNTATDISDSKKVLLIEDNDIQIEGIRDLRIFEGVELDTAKSAREAIQKLLENQYCCIILDLGLPDTSGQELIRDKRFKNAVNNTPVIVYTGRDLDLKESRELEMFAKRVVLKNEESYERLQEEVALFLHESTSYNDDTEQMLKNAKEGDFGLEGKRILIVDDDVRNIFAITNYLESYGMDILYAENGVEALDIIFKEGTSLDLVLMDIMMPEMDGHTAIGKIREQDNLKGLPVIALTAKAMKGDRDECIRMGASDYISKPVDMDKLVSLMKLWISRNAHA